MTLSEIIKAVEADLIDHLCRIGHERRLVVRQDGEEGYDQPIAMWIRDQVRFYEFEMQQAALKALECQENPETLT